MITMFSFWCLWRMGWLSSAIDVVDGAYPTYFASSHKNGTKLPDYTLSQPLSGVYSRLSRYYYRHQQVIREKHYCVDRTGSFFRPEAFEDTGY